MNQQRNLSASMLSDSSVLVGSLLQSITPYQDQQGQIYSLQQEIVLLNRQINEQNNNLNQLNNLLSQSNQESVIVQYEATTLANALRQSQILNQTYENEISQLKQLISEQNVQVNDLTQKLNEKKSIGTQVQKINQSELDVSTNFESALSSLQNQKSLLLKNYSISSQSYPINQIDSSNSSSQKQLKFYIPTGQTQEETFENSVVNEFRECSEHEMIEENSHLRAELFSIESQLEKIKNQK